MAQLPRMDFSSIQKAIQDAFDTYWNVREGRRQSGEAEKNRQSAMAMAQMGEMGSMARTRLGEQGATSRLNTELGAREKEAEAGRSWQGIQNELDRQLKLALQNKELAEKKKLDVALDIPRIMDSAQEMIRGVMAAIQAGEQTLFLSYPNFTPADWKTFATLKDPNLLQAVKKKVIAYYKEITGEAAKISGVDIGKQLESAMPVQWTPIDVEKGTKGLEAEIGSFQQRAANEYLRRRYGEGAPKSKMPSVEEQPAEGGFMNYLRRQFKR